MLKNFFTPELIAGRRKYKKAQEVFDAVRKQVPAERSHKSRQSGRSAYARILAQSTKPPLDNAPLVP